MVFVTLTQPSMTRSIFSMSRVEYLSLFSEDFLALFRNEVSLSRSPHQSHVLSPEETHALSLIRDPVVATELPVAIPKPKAECVDGIGYDCSYFWLSSCLPVVDKLGLLD